MRKNTIAIIVIFAWFLMGTTTAVFAQHHGFGLGKGMGMHEKNLENLRLLKLMEILDLNDDQNDRFIAAFSLFRNKNRDLNQDLEKETEILAELIKSENYEDNKIIQQVDKIRKLKHRRMELADEFHAKVSEILTAVQMGKMTVFEERFERELLETIRGFRGRRPPAVDTPLFKP